MAALGVCCLALVVLAGAPWWSVAFVAVSPLLLGYLAVSRYDLWPAALLAGALAALLADRHRLGWGLLGAAVAAKLYPLVVRAGRRRVDAAPARARASWRGAAAIGARGRRGRLRAVRRRRAARDVGQRVGPALAAAPDREPRRRRSLTTFGKPLIVDSHGSQSIDGHGTLAALSSLCGAAVLVALWVAFARGAADRERFVRYAAACVCAFVAFGKVLSPQYLIWLVPLVALVRGRRGIAAVALLVAALVATQAWFPDHYWAYVDDLDRAWLVLLRNLLLVALVAVLSLPSACGQQARRATHARSIGTVKLRSCPSPASRTPTTFPSRSSAGPPEFPGLAAASVWISL